MLACSTARSPSRHAPAPCGARCRAGRAAGRLGHQRTRGRRRRRLSMQRASPPRLRWDSLAARAWRVESLEVVDDGRRRLRVRDGRDRRVHAAEEVLPALLDSSDRGARLGQVAAVGKRRRPLPAPGALAARAARQRRRAGKFGGLTAGRRHLRPPLPRAGPSDPSARSSTSRRWTRARSSSTRTSRAKCCARASRRRPLRDRRTRGHPREDVRRGREPRRVANGRRGHLR